MQIDAGQILARQVYAISRLTPTVMLANIVNALSVPLVLWMEDQVRLDALLWSSLVIVMALIFLVRYRARREKPFPDRLSPRTYRRSIFQATLMGLLWAYPGLFVLPQVDGPAQAFLVVMAAGMIAGGAITLYPLPVAAYAFCGSILVGSFLGFSQTGEPTFWAFALVAVTFSLIIHQSIKRHNSVFVSEFEARRMLDRQNEHIKEMLEIARNEALEERQRSEERLLQTQKLEAVGQLTAGIAHDFNNLLTAIRGHAELLALSNSAEDDLIDPIVQSSDRGAELVRRLLAFSRQQQMAPRPVCPRDVINDTVALMRRTLRENIDVTVDIASAPWAILIDPGLLGNAILNLGMNARDAMPEGGTITISLANFSKDETLQNSTGDFVRLSVHDTGHGMSEEIRSRAIEPFFTTKEFGIGSGMGLSMVYGFAMQSGGTMSIDSREGAGTTVSLFLPRALEAPEPIPAPAEQALPTGEGRRVLLVEDNSAVRRSLIRQMQSLGYIVSATDSVEAAESVLRQSQPDPDLVVSDIVLPGGRRGTELIRDLRRTHPDMGVLLISGYATPDTDIAPGIDEGVFLLNKPFSRAELAVAMAKALRTVRLTQR